MKICKICGERNPAENNFCQNCGGKEFELPLTPEVKCPRCGAKCDSLYTHCTNCGCELNTPQTVVAEPVLPSFGGGVAAQSATQTVSTPPVTDTFSCPFCGGQVCIQDVFCPECGKDMSQYNLHKVVKRKICPFCGRPNQMTDTYCNYCFYPLADADTDDFQLDYKQTTDQIKHAYLQSPTSARKTICSNCGTLNDEDRQFCVKCGLKLTVDVPKVYCFVCGQENKPDAVYCTSCRHPLSPNLAKKMEEGWQCACGNFNANDDAYCTECGRPKGSATTPCEEENK